jgi:putative ABC transport system permease protein
MHRAGSTPRAGLGVRAAALAIAALWAAVCAVPLGLAPLVRVGAILALGLVSLVLGVRLLLPPLLDAARPAFERVLPGIGRLAGASLVARPLHSALHVAAVAGVVAGITVTGILQRSLARTIDTWTSSQFPDAILVTPAVGMSFESQQHLAPDVVAAVRETPGVRAVFEQYATKLLHGGEEVLLSAGDMRVMADAGRLPAIDADPRALALGIAAGEIGVSDQFARRFDVSKGDVLTIATPNGPCDLRVAGILRDYAGPGGSLNLDLAVFDSLWPRPGARNVVVWSSGAPEEIVRSIETQVGGRQPLFFAFGSELEQYATRLLARFTSALDLVAALTTLLGGVAVMNLLLGAVAERRRELRLMRSTGATRGQIATLVVADGAIAGTLGGLAGLGLGVACAVPLTGDLVAASLGWSLEVSIGAASLAKLLGGVVLASLVASAYPAWIARRVMARDVLAGE